MTEPLREGLVLRVDAKVCHVELDGEPRVLPLRGKLFEQPSREKRPIAAGDRVMVLLTEEGGAIEEVLPRTSMLARRTAGEGEQRAQVIAANVTLVLAVSSVVEPPFHADLVDRVLVGAAREGIDAGVVITKVDRDRKGRAAAWAELYRGIGHPVFLTSIAPGAETDDELCRLHDLLHDNLSVLAGLSGVGKSSLLNRLFPGLDLRVGSLSRIRQGRHTTTHSQVIPLPGGGHVLDTPGIRSFGLFGVGTQEIAFYFPELKALQAQCGYRNCLHRDEPGCAVVAALAAGEVVRSRYESYLVMLEEAASRE